MNVRLDPTHNAKTGGGTLSSRALIVMKKDKIVHFFQNRASSQRCPGLLHPGDAAGKRLLRNQRQIGIDTALDFPYIRGNVR